MRVHYNDDPPLTERGREQARAAGRVLRGLLCPGGAAAGCPIVVLCSPTARTVWTAVELCRELGIAELTPHFALNCCAVAKRDGVQHPSQLAQTRPPTVCGGGEEVAAGSADVTLTCWPPEGDAAAVDALNKRQGGFVQLVQQLAGEAAPGAADSVLVLVTHREGIWELQTEVDLQPGCGYCGFFTLCAKGPGRPRPILALDACGPIHSGDGKRREGDTSQTACAYAAALLTSDAGTRLHTALQAGRGRAIYFCGSAGAPPHATSPLWVTPGVEGLWVDGGDMECFEVLEIRSRPVESEGGGGTFVRVKRHSGQEGWTRVEYLHDEMSKHLLERSLVSSLCRKEEAIRNASPQKKAKNPRK
jgi:hypothetical protein